MRLFPIAILSLILCLPCSAAIYKWTNDQGEVVFGDTPPPKQKTELIIQKPINTYSSSHSGDGEEPESDPTNQSQPPASPSYNKLSIIRPKNDSSLLSNTGQVKIKVQLDPPLDSSAGHKINIKIDNQPITTSSSTSITIDNIDRGTHSLTVEVIDSNGIPLKSSSSTFHLRRSSSR